MIIKGILLDLDGVITETSEYHYQAWKELAADIGISIDRRFNERLKGVGRMESLDLILRHGYAEDKYSSAEKTALAEKKNRRYVELLQRLAPTEVLPGIREFLRDARSNGVKLAIASASKNAPFIIKALNLERDIDFIADAAKVARSKPFPDVFLEAARGISMQAENCIGIEDAAAGIEAIHAAGMKAVGIGSAESLHEADLLLSRTDGLMFSVVSSFFETHA